MSDIAPIVLPPVEPHDRVLQDGAAVRTAAAAAAAMIARATVRISLIQPHRTVLKC